MQDVPAAWGLNMYRYSQGSLLTPIERVKVKSGHLFLRCLSDLQYGMEQICDRQMPRSVLGDADFFDRHR
jgi:hypothetical protein